MTAPLMTAGDVAALLGVTTSWVYAEVRAGRLPHVKLGRFVRFRRESIEAWLADLEAATLPPTTKRPRAAGTAGGMAQGA